jgi:hypothetical protein
MTTSSPPVGGNSVRQQLDELDALLQRMLELPINQLDETTPPPESPRLAAKPQPTPLAPPPPQAAAAPSAKGWRPPAMVLLADSGPVQQPRTSPEDQGWAINLNPQQGSSILGPRSPAAVAARAPAPETVASASPPVWRAETVTYVPPPAVAPAPTRPQPQPSVASEPTASPVTIRPMAPPRPTAVPAMSPRAPLLLLPLVALNRTFDVVVIQFGPLGRSLRSPLGRTALGVSGLLMLAGGVAWGVLDWIGWTW